MKIDNILRDLRSIIDELYENGEYEKLINTMVHLDDICKEADNLQFRMIEEGRDYN